MSAPGKAFKPTITSPPYLIDEILPSTEIHLLAGPTGAGKTRWLFDMLMDWERGFPVLGFKSHSVPWIYIANDRSMDGVNRTLDTMGIDREAFNVIPAWDERLTFPQIVDCVVSARAKLAVIEGFGAFVDPPCTSHQVRNFLRAACCTIKANDITIIGVVEQPKMKPKDVYSNPRQRVSGAATWGHHTETIFLVEPADVSNVADPRRLLTVCPRNSASVVMEGNFSEDGHLLFSKVAEGYRNGKQSPLRPN